jgi:hypothetical protein
MKLASILVALAFPAAALAQHSHYGGQQARDGEYRPSHLETHRRMRALLTAEQVKRYDHARGYASSKPDGHSDHKH